MDRNRNTNRNGRQFDSETVQKVWDKCSFVPGRGGETHRYDACGIIIYRYSYGQETEMGWEIDHIKPVAKEGSDNLSNLQALQARLNAKKGDTYPWTCPKLKI